MCEVEVIESQIIQILANLRGEYYLYQRDNGNLNPNLRQCVFEVEVIESQIMQILRICVGSDSMKQVEQIGGSVCYPLFVGADNGNRTHDLVITNDVLYRLSHISESNYRPCYYIKYGVVCQDLYAKILKIKFRSTVQIPAIIEERILKTKNLPYLISASGQSDII